MFAANLILKFNIMLKEILNLTGAQVLNKSEQKNIFGGMLKKGGGCCNPTFSCCVPQPIPYTCAAAGCATASTNCQYAYGDPNCPDPNFASCCI